MNPDDPEARIRDLEQQVSKTAAASEAPHLAEGARTGLRLGWLVLGVMILAVVVSGGILAGRLTGGSRPVTGTPRTVADGGGTFTQPTLEKPTLEKPFPGAPSVVPPEKSTAPVTITPPSGDSISVAGVGKTETIDCADRVASVSGVDNQVVLTGHCSRVDVSGVRNTVRIEESDAIVVSGMDNEVTFRSGDPELSRSGLGNSLEMG